ncbi:MAG: hypothetical protein LBE20_03960 [Deltaproteobacteria bacterium]|nr:hypothetical protein [Deltaproteobacteria bacterium]
MPYVILTVPQNPPAKFIIEGEIRCLGLCLVNTFRVRTFGTITAFSINGEPINLNTENDFNPYHNQHGIKIDLSAYLAHGKNKLRLEILNDNHIFGLGLYPFWLSPAYGLAIIIFLLSFTALLKNNFNKPLVHTKKQLIPAALFFATSIGYALIIFGQRILYELSGAFSVDSSVYLAVGRGITNGLSLYKDLFEIKPPGIFILSALSFWLLDSPFLMNLLQAAVLIGIALIPIVAYFLFTTTAYSLSKFAFAALSGLLLSLYSAYNAGEVQIESFGAVFSCIAILALGSPYFLANKKTHLTIVALGMLCACGLKEPFLLPIFGASILFCSNFKDWVLKFFYPLLLAASAGIILLLLFGWFDGFMQYLQFMFSTHILRHGSPLQRGLDIYRLWDDLNKFSSGLSFAISLSLLVQLFSRKIPLFALALFCASLAVGLGGEYFDHHFVFAVPFYMSLFLLILKHWSGKNIHGNNTIQKSGAAVLFFLLLATMNLPDFKLEQKLSSIHHDTKLTLAEAKYLDAVLDRTKIERYAFLGANGIQIYAWTKHSPQGPHFVQVEEWVNTMPTLQASILNNLLQAQVIVVDRITDNLKFPARRIINEFFTEEPWLAVSDIERQAKFYQIYFRKGE